MKKILLLIAFLMQLVCAFADVNPEESLNKLDASLARKRDFLSQKVKKINRLKEEIQSINENNLQGKFEVYKKLYNEYRSFNFDTAFNYTQKLHQIATVLGDREKEDFAKIQLGFILLSSGMYKETFDSLKIIKSKSLSPALKPDYYSLMGLAYYNLGDYNKDSHFSSVYDDKANWFIDSALSLMKPNSFEYQYLEGLKKLKEGDKDEAKIVLLKIFKDFKLTNHEYAITASTLSDIYIRERETDKAIDLLAKAAIADVESSTKETTALLHLAELLYKKGDVKRAYDYIELALQDAMFYGARQRKIQVGAILPIIASEKLNDVEKKRKALFLYASVITLLTAMVIAFALIIVKQLRKLKEAEKIIIASNDSLKEVNQRLMEANKIKEEYIGYYFNINSEYIDKIERFKRNIDQKLSSRRFEEIQLIINRINLKKEREELYLSFDKVFLRLFPNFVAEFNSLFKEEDQFRLPNNQLLNTELRIFALIRMGISDNERIAHILDYSVNTIYTYKTRVKNKSIVANEEFEDRVMEIKAV